jgi:fructokinase
MTGRDHHQLEELGDEDPVWERVGGYLGQLCYSILVLANPEVIVLGGGVARRKAVFPYIHKAFMREVGGYIQHEKV